MGFSLNELTWELGPMSSIPNLAPGDVTVVDNYGNLLTENNLDPSMIPSEFKTNGNLDPSKIPTENGSFQCSLPKSLKTKSAKKIHSTCQPRGVRM